MRRSTIDNLLGAVRTCASLDSEVCGEVAGGFAGQRSQLDVLATSIQTRILIPELEEACLIVVSRKSNLLHSVT